MELKLKAAIQLYYPGNMPNTLNWSTMSSKMWGIDITVRFSKQRDNAITIFKVFPPITTPHKLWKELTFKTTSYKELRKWLKKNQDRVGMFSNLGL